MLITVAEREENTGYQFGALKSKLVVKNGIVSALITPSRKASVYSDTDYQ